MLKLNKSNSEFQLSWENIEILGISPITDRGNLKAFANIRVGLFVISDCRIIQEPGKKPWFSLPVLSYKTQHGTVQYKTLVQILDENLKNQISQVVLEAWEESNGGSNGHRKGS